MKNSTLFALGSALVLGLPSVASAYDDDPGYGQFRPWYGGEDRTYRRSDSGNYGGGDRRYLEPIYYRPTQRYYGKGYTVSYRYMPVYWQDMGSGQQRDSSNFRSEAFLIAATDIPAWGARAPRLVQTNRKTPAQTAITSITSTNKAPSPVDYSPQDLPAPSAPLPTPNLNPAATPAPAPAPVAPAPAPLEAPKP